MAERSFVEEVNTMPDHPRFSRQDLIDFVVHEAYLIDQRRFDDWNALFAPEGLYWIPLRADQQDGVNEASYMHEDQLLRDIRVQRLKSPRAFSQQPPSRCQHVLQTPVVEAFDPEGRQHVLRTPFYYAETQAGQVVVLAGTARHHLCERDGALRITLKRVELLNDDSPLPMVQLFV